MIREYLEELREHWDDSYWRADHPEVMAVLVGLLTGLLGLFFAWLEVHLIRAQRKDPAHA